MDGGGSDYSEEVYFFDGTKEIVYPRSHPDVWQADDVRWAAERIIVTFDGVHYIVGKDKDSRARAASPDYVRYAGSVSTDGVLELDCKFSHRRDRAVRVGANESVCAVALDGALDYLPFDAQHRYRASDEENMVSELAAAVDYDNDGTCDLIVYVTSRDTAGCERTYLAALDETRAARAGSPTAELLRGIDGGCAGPAPRPAVRGGSVYLEQFYPYDSRRGEQTVFKIERGRRGVVGEIETRVIHEVRTSP